MKRVFVDTGGFVALLVAEDKMHPRASNLFESAALALILLTAAIASGFAARAEASSGRICIAPFSGRAPLTIGEPNLSETTWSPQRGSHFKFYVDGRLRATITDGESADLKGLPTSRPVRIRVVLDGKAFEAFKLNLGSSPGHRICLWLYPGYWHWIDNGWDAALGCRCGETPAPGGT